MKSKEEIDELYHKYWDDFSSNYDDNLHYYSFVEGYTQCQEDMAKKIEILQEQIKLKDAAYSELGNKYSHLLFKLNKQD